MTRARSREKRDLFARFREVDDVPTPWDGIAHTGERGSTSNGDRPRGPRFARAALVGAAAALGVAAAIVLLVPSHREAPDASWLTRRTEASCIDRFSPETLKEREWAFEGRIAGVRAPSDPDSSDPGDTVTLVTFDVVRWFWGGEGDTVTREVYADPSSAGSIDDSVGADLLAAGDERYLWLCGFTQDASPQRRTMFEQVAVERSPTG